MQKQINELTDLELAQLSTQFHQQFIQTQSTLVQINQEIENRLKILEKTNISN